MSSSQRINVRCHIALALALTPVTLHAGAFTAGNIVVQQADNGSIQNTTIHIVEVDSFTANQPSPVQLIAIPGTTIPTQALRINGSGGTTGYLANTNDRTLLSFAAANAATSADLGQTSAASILPRAVVTLNAAGTMALTTTYTGISGNQCRGATSIDDSAWFIADKGGNYTNGGTSPRNTTNMLCIKTFGGIAYVLSASAPGISTIATPGSTSLTALPGFSVAGLTDFALVSSGVNGATFDMLYTVTNAGATAGTIGKYSLVGGSWVANGSYATNFGGLGLAAAGNGGGASIYVTSGNGSTTGNKVIKLTDTTSYNSAITVSTGSNVTLYTLAGGTTGPIAKGIAFAPLSSALPDLTASVAAPANSVTGANFNYTLTAANSGTANASGVSVQFTLPVGLAFVSATDNGTNGFTGSNNSGVVTFTGGTLNAGSSDTLTVTVTAAAPGTYTAAAGSAVIDPSNTIAESNENNNSSPVAASTSVGSVVDLTADVSGPSGTTANTDFTYVITVRNIGTAAASGVPVQFTLPSGLIYVSATDSGDNGFSPAFGAGVVSFTGGSLAVGASDALHVTVSAAAAGTFNVPVGAAVVNGSHVITENNYANNASATSVATVITAADLAVLMIHNGSFAPGDAADTYTVYVSNNGGASTNGSEVAVTITLPAGLAPAASMNGSIINGWNVTVAGQTVIATRSDVLATGTGYPALTVTVTVATDASGPLAATVSATGGGNVAASNNTITGSVTVGTPTPVNAPGNLIVSKSIYSGSADTVAYPGTLPNGTPSVADGSYPGVWGNESPDASFGVTSPIYLEQLSKSGASISSFNLTSAVRNQLGLDVSTSYPSKSELALNPTPAGDGLTFMCYLAAPNSLDVSNADTPYHVDSTNPVTGIGPRQRAVVQVDFYGNVQVTPVNSYSGNNGRAAILAGGNYFTVGNAGNGSGSASTLTMLSDNTGVQLIAPGAGGNATVVGAVNGTANTSSGYERGFSLASLGFAADKTGKDMNLRGLTLNPFNNTLYASKGSGGNGVNTVYQIGGGGIPTTASAGTTPVTILPGFSQTSAASGLDASGHPQTVYYPFGLWFANATTLYVADEGVPSTATTYNSATNQYTSALPANNPTAGLQKWTFDGSKWNLAYTLQNGLNLGIPYAVADYPTGNNPATGMPWAPAANGLRNITGQVNADGTVTIYGVTSTASGETDQGADPNQLVAVTDSLAATTLPANESFTVLKTASNQEVLRGVALSTPITPILTVLDAWRQTYFPGSTATTDNGADAAIPMHDGVENIVKFATGLDPTKSDAMPSVIAQSNDHSKLTFTYTPSTAAVADGFKFAVEYSDTLAPGSWKTDFVDQGAVGAGGVPVTAQVPMGSGGSRFLHLKIMPPP